MKRRALSILCLLALLTLVLAVVPGTAALRLDAVQDTQLPPPKAEPSIQAIRTPADAPGTPSASEDAHAEKARLSPQSILLDEGFEGGAVPPSGWTLVQTNFRET
jgi:hypothetical protein